MVFGVVWGSLWWPFSTLLASNSSFISGLVKVIIFLWCFMILEVLRTSKMWWKPCRVLQKSTFDFSLFDQQKLKKWPLRDLFLEPFWMQIREFAWHKVLHRTWLENSTPKMSQLRPQWGTLSGCGFAKIGIFGDLCTFSLWSNLTKIHVFQFLCFWTLF